MVVELLGMVVAVQGGSVSFLLFLSCIDLNCMGFFALVS